MKIQQPNKSCNKIPINCNRHHSLANEAQEKLKLQNQLTQTQTYMKQSPIHPHILQDQSEVDWCHGFLKYMDPPGKVTQLLIENHATYLPFYKKVL